VSNNKRCALLLQPDVKNERSKYEGRFAAYILMPKFTIHFMQGINHPYLSSLGTIICRDPFGSIFVFVSAHPSRAYD
jgi:hypothetical protein